MANVNEKIVSSSYRVWSKLDQLWKKMSFWNKASDTECDDGQSVEDKIGSVKGVTTSMNITENGYLLDGKVVADSITELNNALENKSKLLRLISYTKKVSVPSKSYKSLVGQKTEYVPKHIPVFAFISLGENGVYATPQFSYELDEQALVIKYDLHIGNWSDTEKEVTCNINVVYGYED